MKKDLTKIPKKRSPSQILFGYDNVFINRVGGLLDTLNLVLPVLRSRRDGRQNLLKKALTKIGKKTRMKSIDSYNLSLEINSLQRELGRASFSARAVPNNLFVAMVAEYDIFFINLLKFIYDTTPDLLRASVRQLTWREISEFNEVSDIRKNLIASEIDSITRKSRSEQIEWMEKQFNLQIRDKISWTSFVEMTERRNVIVHADGLVTEQYMANCKKNQIDVGVLKFGDKLRVDQEYFSNAADNFIVVTIILSQLIYRKLLSKDLDPADRYLMETTVRFIEEDKLQLALQLAKFSNNGIVNIFSDEVRLIYKINLAQIYKWRGETELMNKVLDGIDWSSVKDDFQLARAVLIDDFHGAAQLMKKIGRGEKGSEKIPYQRWPLYREFRKKEIFRKTFKQIFREEFTNTSLISELLSDVKKFKLKDLKISRHRHKELPDALIARIKRFKEILVEVEPSPLDETLDSFKRDANPESEVEIWEKISSIYKDITDGYPNLDLDQKREIFKTVLGVTSGVEIPRAFRYIPEDVSELLKKYFE